MGIHLLDWLDAGVKTLDYLARPSCCTRIWTHLNLKGGDEGGAPAFVAVRAKFKRGSFGSVGRKKRVQLRSG
jgi:hypothetical protein